MPTLQALEPGTKLQGGRYKIVGTLGNGGFSIVYHATHRNGAIVAIKELFPLNGSRKSFFGLWKRKSVRKTRDWRSLEYQTRIEFQTVKSLQHPNIVRVYELFDENNTIYIVMELIDGKTLHDLLNMFPNGLTEPEAVRIGGSIGDALAYSHSKGILHRDVKPSNIMIASDGRVVLVDFGVAKTVRTNQARTRIGTEGYMAPEQLGSQPQSQAVDIYGLAATIYHALTGQVPPRPADRRKRDLLVSPRLVKPDLSATVSDSVMWGLALKPGDRPRNMTTFTDVLRGLMTVPPPMVQVESHGGWYKSAIVVACLAVIALVWNGCGNERKLTPFTGPTAATTR